MKSGPLHIQGKPRGQAPAPLVPMSLSHGENFVSFNNKFHLALVTLVLLKFMCSTSIGASMSEAYIDDCA